MFKGSLIELAKVMNLYDEKPVEWYAVYGNRVAHVRLHSAVQDWLEAYRSRLIDAINRKDWDIIAQMVSEADLALYKLHRDADTSERSRVRALHLLLHR